MSSSLPGTGSPGATPATTAPTMMAAASNSPVDSPKPVAIPMAVPAKRRRRTPATGAADDCFACRRRQMKCDRRRPYCTQCLDMGKDCSGYKTQLTWGVGVASRGKLRGQSLPIAMKGTAPPKASARRPRLVSSTTTGTATTTAGPMQSSSTSKEQSTNPSPISRPVRTQPRRMATAPAQFQFNSLDRATTAVPQQPGVYSPVLDYSMLESSHQRSSSLYAQRRPYHHSLQLNTPLASSYEEYGLPTSGSSMSGFSESEVGTPLDYPDTPASTTSMLGRMPMYETLPSQPMMPMMPMSSRAVSGEHHLPTSYPEQYERTMSARSFSGSNHPGRAMPDGSLRKPPPTPTMASSSPSDMMAGGLMLNMGGGEVRYGYDYPAPFASSSPRDIC
ncbi:MAG: hypothetical protein M1823_001886 [Watsoniomyces obsoletus]|nr:MAG: hypothetical protein M1823_001886 [Watsoniomyces obsoletus]